MKKIITIMWITFLPGFAFSESPNLDLLTQEQADAVSKEFSANFIHTAVAPASSLGNIFGFEVGLVAGVTETPEIDRLSKTFDPNVTIDKIPHAGLLGVLSIPFGLTAEISMIPKVGSDVTLEYTSYALKWTFSKYLPLPFDLAARVHGSNSTLSYEDIINNTSTGNTDVNTKVSYKTGSFGYNLSLSKKLFIFEPYAGIGHISTDTKIKTAASANVSIFTFTADDQYNSKNSGTHFFLGTNLNLFLLKLGAEYSKVMDIDRYTMKLSLYF